MARNKKKIIYVDTENNFSVERLKQIARYDYNKILGQIFFLRPTSFEEQKRAFDKLRKIVDKNIGLIVVDTFNSFYCLMLENDEKFANRSLNRQITDLQITAMNRKIYVIIVGQVYTTENNDVKPFAGRGIERMIKTIIKLEKTDDGKRQATIIKHQSQPKGKKVFFKITSKGLE